MRRIAALVLALMLAAAPASAQTSDPLEPMNRGIFWFNDKADVYVFEPVARGWDFVVPGAVQTSIANFFRNYRFPVDAINATLQGKPGVVATTTGRFVINTTVGVLGFLDPATGWGLEYQNEDFGQTLGWWGTPPGPYLVLPFFGPANIRDGAGRIVDIPFQVTPFFVNGLILTGATVIETVNFRAQILDDVENAKRAALDYYVFVRNAYGQRRDALVNDSMETPETEANSLYDDLYEDQSGDGAAPADGDADE